MTPIGQAQNWYWYKTGWYYSVEGWMWLNEGLPAEHDKESCSICRRLARLTVEESPTPWQRLKKNFIPLRQKL